MLDLTNPLITFLIGIGIGLILVLITWINGFFRRRSVVKETQRLREQLHRQMEINEKGNTSIRRELDTLRQANENLRVSVATLKSKPGRAELQTLHVYDKAIHSMFERAPGFAPAWEGVLKDAQEEVEKTESGLKPLLRKVFRPSLTRWSNGGAIAAPSEVTDAETAREEEKPKQGAD